MADVRINNGLYRGVDTVKLPLIAGNGNAVFVYSHDEIIEIPQDGYVFLDYIESSGTQYIDTGISGGSSMGYELVFNPLGSRNPLYSQYFAGSGSKTQKLFLRDGMYIATKDRNQAQVNMASLDSNDHTVRLDGNKLYFDGSYVIDGVGSGWGTTSWYVFTSYEEPHLLATMRLYSLKMYRDGELVRDFVPCKKMPEGTIGLYDNVSGEFFENAGTGAFTGA